MGYWRENGIAEMGLEHDLDVIKRVSLCTLLWPSIWLHLAVAGESSISCRMRQGTPSSADMDHYAFGV